ASFPATRTCRGNLTSLEPWLVSDQRLPCHAKAERYHVDARKILADLKARKYGPVYFLYGEEPYFIDLIAGYIEANVLSDAEKGFDRVVIYGKDSPMATILTHASRYPMMAERQVVIVREAQDIPDLNRESGSKLLLNYLQRPVPPTVHVFCHKHKSLDKRRALGKQIDKLAITLDSRKLYDRQLPESIVEYFKDRKVQIEAKAVDMLAEYVGNDLTRLTNEIDKLLLNRKEGETVTAEQVAKQVGI